MLFSELKEKDVINIKTCKKIGRVCNLEFDMCTGQICKLIVPGHSTFCNLFSCEPEVIICYKDIKQIGPDIILVDL